MDEDWYAVLGVPRGAAEAEIKLAYRELALIHHPDRNPHDAAAAKKFMRIQKAYEALSDPRERALHDQDLLFRAGQARSSKLSEAGEPKASWRPDPPPVRKKHERGLTGREATARLVIYAGGAMAVRGLLGVYGGAGDSAPSRWLAMSGGQDRAFLLMLAGLAVAFIGAGTLLQRGGD